MELFIKHFDELTNSELYDILKLRNAIFIVEQNCPYQDMDDKDQNSYHLFLKDNGSIIACLRVIYHDEYKNAYMENAPVLRNVAAIGRVVSSVRRQGHATLLLREAIKLITEKFDVSTVTLEAQVYARALYEGVGFAQSSDEFLEDGIPHIQMMLNLK